MNVFKTFKARAPPIVIAIKQRSKHFHSLNELFKFNMTS